VQAPWSPSHEYCVFNWGIEFRKRTGILVMRRAISQPFGNISDQM
jgi:hypothetical protein